MWGNNQHLIKINLFLGGVSSQPTRLTNVLGTISLYSVYENVRRFTGSPRLLLFKKKSTPTQQQHTHRIFLVRK